MPAGYGRGSLIMSCSCLRPHHSAVQRRRDLIMSFLWLRMVKERVFVVCPFFCCDGGGRWTSHPPTEEDVSPSTQAAGSTEVNPLFLQRWSQGRQHLGSQMTLLGAPRKEHLASQYVIFCLSVAQGWNTPWCLAWVFFCTSQQAYWGLFGRCVDVPGTLVAFCE